jgi:HEAT repeat protein
MDLGRLADDEDPRVRAAALRAMGARAARGNEDESDVTLMRLEAALSDEGGVAMAAVEALRALGTPQAGAAARALLGRDDPELVQAAVGCVGAHAERGQLDALLPLVGHPHWSVRAEAVQILADRSVVAAVPAILRRLETEQDDFVRDAILRALRKLEE